MIYEIQIKKVIFKKYLRENKKINRESQNFYKLVSKKIEVERLSITLACFLKRGIYYNYSFQNFLLITKLSLK